MRGVYQGLQGESLHLCCGFSSLPLPGTLSNQFYLLSFFLLGSKRGPFSSILAANKTQQHHLPTSVPNSSGATSPFSPLYLLPHFLKELSTLTVLISHPHPFLNPQHLAARSPLPPTCISLRLNGLAAVDSPGQSLLLLSLTGMLSPWLPPQHTLPGGL